MNLSLDRSLAAVLVPVFALRGQHDLGIGDIAALREFIAWAARSGFSLVKILPINETGGDHSPYNAISSRALEPTTIDTQPGELPDLRQADFDEVLAASASPSSPDLEHVDYPRVKALKRRLLEKAFERFNHGAYRRATGRGLAFRQFLEMEGPWLQHYALFRVLMGHYAGSEMWDRWSPEHRTPQEAEHWLGTLPKRRSEELRKRMRYFCYVQWIAFEQWRNVKAHANQAGIALMGDIPFGVSFYSADVWANPTQFQGQWCGGTPPDTTFKHDAFVQKWGQNWGIPLYDWKVMQADGFRWWRDRVHGVREFFDLFRIDHILGFYRIYAFPWRPDRNPEFLPLTVEQARERLNGETPRFHPHPDDTDKHKAANRESGELLLRAIIEEAGPGRLVGEDLGEVPDYVRPSLASLGIAGYKIPYWEMQADGRLVEGRKYERLSLAMYGTHDHAPLKAMWESLAAASQGADGLPARAEMQRLGAFAGIAPDALPLEYTRDLHTALLRALFASNSWIAAVMITDLFARTERFNLPGVGAGNWTRRLHLPVAQLDSDESLPPLREMIAASQRLP